ncbi:MAG TPA: M48 family metalloprotease [Prolixibacteraceae bacterium]|nr:M48 family metalloprotease [Prolixibacteraceae bacterium]
MKQPKIKLSPEFKTQTTKAILAIGFFVLTYFLLLVLTLGLTALCIAAGGYLIILKPMFVTLAVGIGLASLGILVLIFLLKFIFKSHKSDRSHLVEITRSEEPELFQMIDEIVKEVKTSFPKRVYLSTDVNAAVFYDSSFWSMFLPVEKNLQIGVGLVNTVTREELKAILSHEFGHFSQKTMKVGSFVYNLNQVIFNMLYDNESYENIIQKWADVSGYFSIFVAIAVKINAGIQWILRKLYEVVNTNYLGLSREMEFHADEIAASVTGYEPLKSSLLRMSLADNSFSEAINFYNGKISDNIKSENIYRDQTAVIKFLAETNNFPIQNDLPAVSLEEQSKFDKSKLVIKNQWASHPTIKDRIKRLESTGFSAQNTADTLANNVFRNIEETQIRLTSKLFETVSYPGKIKFISSDNFQEEYKSEVLSNSFAKIYNGYYDHKTLTHIDLNQSKSIDSNLDFNELFADDKVDLVYTAIAMKNDMDALNNISNNSLPVKTFDYDGIRYKRKDAVKLNQKLNSELESLNEQIKENDQKIYEFFRKAEAEQNKPQELQGLYSEFLDYDKSFDTRYDLYIKLLNELQFLNTTTPFEQIRANFSKIMPMEEMLKTEINQLLSDYKFQTEITKEIRENLELYTSKRWEYFGVTMYYDENLTILNQALRNFGYLLSRGYFLMKKQLLAYQEELSKGQAQQCA